MDVLYVCCHGGLSISYVNNEKSGIFSVLFLLTDVEDVNNKGNLSNPAKYDLIGYSLRIRFWISINCPFFYI